jgi:hypothetical protein
MIEFTNKDWEIQESININFSQPIKIEEEISKVINQNIEWNYCMDKIGIKKRERNMFKLFKEAIQTYIELVRNWAYEI